MSTEQIADHKTSGTVPNQRLTASDAHDLLSNTRRRRALRYVVDRGIVDKTELIDAVATQEYGLSRAELTHQQRKRVQVSLSQVHIPKLADHDVIDVADGEITTGPNASRVLAFDADSRGGRGFLGRVVSTVTR